jgi:hypothetical protein
LVAQFNDIEQACVLVENNWTPDTLVSIATATHKK